MFVHIRTLIIVNPYLSVHIRIRIKTIRVYPCVQVSPLREEPHDEPLHPFIEEEPLHPFIEEEPLHPFIEDEPLHPFIDDDPLHGRWQLWDDG
jgi:hypothetical protein